MAGKVTVKGLKELARKLESMPKEIRSRDMNYATRKGSLAFTHAAQQHAPKKTGKLARNIVSRKNRKTLFDSEYRTVVRSVGKADNANNAFYAYFVEYGTKNTPAHPFIRPAFDLERGNAISIFKDRIAHRVKKFGRK